MDKTKQYLVLNYSTSPIGIATRNENYVIEGGSDLEPTSLPFTLDELFQINANSNVFKTGALRFEKEYEKEIYEELRIRNWEDILTNEQIEKIITKPTIESLQKVIDITTEMYFERIYGIYMGLRNLGVPISENVRYIMTKRRKEFAKNKRTTSIELTSKNISNDMMAEDVDSLKEQNEKLSKQLEEMQKKMEDFMKANQATENAISNGNEEPKTMAVNEIKKTVGRPKKK